MTFCTPWPENHDYSACLEWGNDEESEVGPDEECIALKGYGDCAPGYEYKEGPVVGQNLDWYDYY